MLSTRVAECSEHVFCSLLGTSSDAFLVLAGSKRNYYPPSHTMNTHIKIHMYVCRTKAYSNTFAPLFAVFERRTAAFWTQWDVSLFRIQKKSCRDSRVGPIFSLCFKQWRSPPCDRPDLNDNFLCNGALNFIAAWIML